MPLLLIIAILIKFVSLVSLLGFLEVAGSILDGILEEKKKATMEKHVTE